MKARYPAKRLLLIGVDGATLDLINLWIDDLPNFAQLLKGGAWGRLESTPDQNSAASWSSIVTGKNPGKHGIFWFVEYKEGSYDYRYINASYRDGKTLWRLLSEAGKRVGAINVPISYPAEEVNGFVISGIDCPGIEDPRFTYPPELSEEIRKEVGEYIIEPGIPSFVTAGRLEEGVTRLHQTVAQRLAVTKYLMRARPWEFFMVVFTSPDSAQHFYWKYMEPEGFEVSPKEVEKYQDTIRNVYRQVDQALGELLALAGEDCNVLVVSDHGGTAATGRSRFLARWLEAIGVLKYKERGALDSLQGKAKQLCFDTLAWGYRQIDKRFGREFKLRLARLFPRLRERIEIHISYGEIDWPATKAYTDARRPNIWINLRGRQPQGIVEPCEEYERVRDYIIERLMAARDTRTGLPLAEAVLRREEAYHGRHVPKAPDLVIQWMEKAHLDRADLGEETSGVLGEERKRTIFFRGPVTISGGHAKYGVIFMRGPGVKQGVEITGAKVTDVAPTVLYLMGESIPEDMDGRVLNEAFEEELLLHHPIRRVSLEEGEAGERAVYSDEDAQTIGDRLRGLGYVE